jgi:hypothetical protein
MDPLSPRNGASSGCGWKVAANILHKQSRTADKGWSSSLGLGVGLTTHHRKNVTCYEMFQSASDMDCREKIWTKNVIARSDKDFIVLTVLQISSLLLLCLYISRERRSV